MNWKIVIVFPIVSIFIFSLIPLSTAICQQEDGTCPTTDSDCSISCGETKQGSISTIGNSNHWNFSIPAPRRVRIRVDPTPSSWGADYAIYVNYSEGECPTDSSYDQERDAGTEGTPETLIHNFPANMDDTYRPMIKLMNLILGSDSSYDLSLTCYEVPCTDSPPSTEACSIDCDQSFSGLTNTTPASQYYYFNFTLSVPKDVTISVTPSWGADYAIYVNYSEGECPTDSSYDQIADAYTEGGTETLNHDFNVGTYCFLVKLKSSLQSDPSFDMSMSCVELRIRKPTIISPEPKTYYNNTVNLTTKCVGDFESYYINRTLDGDNVTLNGGNPVNNNTIFTEEMTLPWGVHNVYVTCINGSLFKSSDRVYFTLTQPQYEFKAWVEGPDLFTIGRSEIIGIYVRNLGNVKDSYTIGYNKSAELAEFPGEDFSHLLGVYFPSNRIIPIEPNRTGYTFATVTLLGPISNGNIIFNITSVENSSVSQEIQPFEIITGMPINLPEFGWIGLIQIFIIVILFQTAVFIR